VRPGHAAATLDERIGHQRPIVAQVTLRRADESSRNEGKEDSEKKQSEVMEFFKLLRAPVNPPRRAATQPTRFAQILGVHEKIHTSCFNKL